MLATIATCAIAASAHAPAASRGSVPTTSEGRTRARPYRTVVQSEPTPRQRERDSVGFVTVVAIEDDRARKRDGIADVLAAAPATYVRSLGGLGQFSAVSLRGSAPQQVGIFLDGVPLGSSLAGLVDLGELPIDGLSRVEIHRGWVPIAFGSAALGGAINLVSATADTTPRIRVEGGGGSFRARLARVELVTTTRRGLHLGVRVGYGGARGDFRFRDQNGTPTLGGDDRDRRRTGNDYDRLLAQLRLDGRRGPWRLGGQQMFIGKQQGIPGPASAQARLASLSSLTSRTIVNAWREGFARPGTRLQWIAGVGVDARRFADPRGELGVGVDDQRTVSIDTYVSPRVRLPLWRGAYTTLMADQRTEWIAIDQRVARVPSGDARRLRASVGAGLELEQFLWNGRAHLVPAVRVDAYASRFAVPRGQGEQDDRGRDEWRAAISPRIGVDVRVLGPLALRGSFGRYFRVPTLVELFGDRGYIVGNEGLRPERGLSADGGLVLDVDRDAIALWGHVAGFWTRSRDLIQWISAGTVARPENIGRARVSGLESSLALVAAGGIAELLVHYTLLDTADLGDDPSRRGRALPGRPRHDLFARASMGHRWSIRGVAVAPRLAYTVEVVARTWLDPSGRYLLPARALQAIGVETKIADRVALALDIRNLLDVRTASVTLPIAGARTQIVPVADFIGYPLPGRSLWVSLRLDFDLPTPRGRRRA